ncbi:MAG: hypothetical protein ACREHG_06110, partial [Candidatus Saccharimonadales bacterium]
FYSINNETKEKFWIGRLINIECILPMEGERVHGIYRRSGWLDEMVRDVESVGGNGRQIPQEESHGMFNCRYRSVNLEVFDEPRPEIDSEDEYLKAFYYDTLTRLPPVTYYGIEESGPRSLKHVDIPNDLSNYGAKGIEKRISKSWNHSSNGIRSDLRHKDWEKKLLERLRKIYGTNNVGIGVPCEAGYIDIVILHKKIKNLIELKTARTAKQVVREALSQVMEYGYWPGMGQGYLRFIISGVPKIDNLTKKYLEFLRGNFKIPIWYLTLDESAMELIGLDSLLNQK